MDFFHSLNIISTAEKEGSSKSLDSVQDLLQEVKGENSKLIGKLHAAESQIESLKKGKDEVSESEFVHISLTLFQTTNFRLFRTERVCK